MEKRSVFKLKVTKSFASSHQLRNYQGKCENLHGHNFIVELMVKGEKLDPQVEYLVDFKVLKEKLNEVIEPLDHIHLNEFPPFDKINPSSENIAKYIYEKVKEKLKDYKNIEIEYVGVAESEKSWAYYMEEEI